MGRIQSEVGADTENAAIEKEFTAQWPHTTKWRAVDLSKHPRQTLAKKPHQSGKELATITAK